MMRFLYGKQDLRSMARAQEFSYLLTNGLGGYSSVTAAFSAPRADQGILVAAVQAPNVRINLVHRLCECLRLGEREVFLSSQEFADGTAPEDGYRHLAVFCCDNGPSWTYQVDGVQVIRRIAMAYGRNTAAVTYTIENRSMLPCTFSVEPFLKFAPKEDALKAPKELTFENGRISAGPYTLVVKTNAGLLSTPARKQQLAYSEDAKDGRPVKGYTASCCTVLQTIPAGQSAEVEILFSTEEENQSAASLLLAQRERFCKLAAACGLTDPAAQQLAVSADAFIAYRDSTNGKTILAGYPLFSDWGRDTMIALCGCTLSTGRYEDAKSILRTFLAYEKDGLVPNLFPEGETKPMYNTVDAALLLIDCIWQYVCRTRDLAFAEEAWPVMERIIHAYQTGTHHSIGMDTDGLIFAGGGLDQVTWMDVCVNGILPTPRHGKPVEINAYWYNALRVMETLSQQMGKDGAAYGKLAANVQKAFSAKFYMPEKGYLRDVLSGTKSDEQLRCNQIWAVSMSFTMLTPEQERSIVDTVFRHLYTPCGLRTLAPGDAEYHPTYGGDQVKRDMAYHQGTTWVFPMGAYYLAYLKTRGFTAEAAQTVKDQLAALEPMLREGCVGQLPEIYDGEFPTESKGCFAQAWSVGEMLRVYEAIETIASDKRSFS